MILKPAADVRNHERDLSYALNEYAATRDAAKAYRKIGRNAFSNEGQLLLSLMKTRGDLVGALDAVSTTVARSKKRVTVKYVIDLKPFFCSSFQIVAAQSTFDVYSRLPELYLE